MKKFLVAFMLIFSAVAVSAANTMEFLANDDARQALYGALDKALPALKNAPFGNRTVAILPMKIGHNILAGRLKDMLVKSGFVCVEGKEDPMWDEILKEIEWDERKDDILDPATIVRFGKLKAAHILMQCEIRVLDKNTERVFAEIELRATDIATKRVIWGGTFTNRFYISKKVQGIIDLDFELRELLRKNFEKVQKSLNSSVTSAKFNNIKTVTVVPLSGDIDSYITELAAAMLTRTNLMPQNSHIPSLAQVRATSRDGLLNTDAVLYGSVRALHKTEPTECVENNKVIINYDVVAEIQISIEDAKTGNIIWSESLPVKENISSEREMTAEEIDELAKGLGSKIKLFFVEHWLGCILTVVIIIVAAIVLRFAVALIKALIANNNIR